MATTTTTQRWTTLKANADAYADLHARSRALWRPIAADLAALRAEYPSNQAFSAALEAHGLEFNYNDRAALVQLGQTLTTESAMDLALALSPRESVRTFCDAVKESRRPSSQPCEDETARSKAVAQPPAVEPVKTTTDPDAAYINAKHAEVIRERAAGNEAAARRAEIACGKRLTQVRERFCAENFGDAHLVAVEELEGLHRVLTEWEAGLVQREAALAEAEADDWDDPLTDESPYDPANARWLIESALREIAKQEAIIGKYFAQARDAGDLKALCKVIDEDGEGLDNGVRLGWAQACMSKYALWLKVEADEEAT